MHLHAAASRAVASPTLLAVTTHMGRREEGEDAIFTVALSASLGGGARNGASTPGGARGASTVAGGAIIGVVAPHRVDPKRRRPGAKAYASSGGEAPTRGAT